MSVFRDAIVNILPAFSNWTAPAPYEEKFEAENSVYYGCWGACTYCSTTFSVAKSKGLITALRM